jgi:hypothetical protein
VRLAHRVFVVRAAHRAGPASAGGTRLERKVRESSMAKDAAKATKPEKGAEATQPAEEKKPAEERKPADPRLKVLKKFHGKFLPKGVLRDRHKAIMERWNSGPDHGNVTVEELKKLLDDWRGTREKPPRVPS